MIGNAYQIEPSGCPVCFRKLDGTTCLTADAKPKSGDVSVCFYCASLLEYDENLNVIKMTEKTMRELDLDTQAQLLNAICAIRLSKQKGKS